MVENISKHKNAKFMVPCNWDPKLIDKALKYPVKCFYGKLKTDLIGGGRAPYRLNDVNRQHAEKYIQTLRKNDIDFTYILNTSCMGNREFTNEFRRDLFELLEWIQKSGAKAVTVAVPFLASVVKDNFPKLKINVSKMAKVDSVRKARMWEDLGAVSANLDHNLVKNFQAIRHITSNSDMEFHVIVNDSCLFSCPWDMYHNILESHASMSNRANYVSYCTYNCRKRFTENPAEIIKSIFVRPEDIDEYVDAEIPTFKLIDRIKPTNWIINALDAYSRRKYDGNLLDLFALFSNFGKKPEDVRLLQQNEIKTASQIQQLRSSELFNVNYHIDNSKLNGFFNHFKTHDCQNFVCGTTCRYCDLIAKKALSFDAKRRDIVLHNLKMIVDQLNKL